jgi:DNA-binding MarR family transcriptional regulator
VAPARTSKTPPRKPATVAATPSAAGKTDAWRTKTLQARPGFLIRRLYQIHVALFAEECAAETITPVQYSVLAALERLGTVDQATLSRDVALDRTSVADIVARLEGRRLVKRRASPTDRRMMLSGLTDQGRALLARLETASARAHQRTIAALPAKEKAFFLDTLHRLIEAGDAPGAG